MHHGVHFISCIVLSLLKICIPCVEVIFTSTSTTSTRSQHLKYPWQEVALRLKQTGHSKIQILIYTTGNSASKLNYIIPCLIVM